MDVAELGEKGKNFEQKDEKHHNKPEKAAAGQRKPYGPTPSVHFPDWKDGYQDNKTTQLVVSYEAGKKVSKLREPRSLYELQRRYPSIYVPRWPVEMKVLTEHPRHIEYCPNHPEMFHNHDKDAVTTSYDLEEPIVTEKGRIVYENLITKTNYFDRSRPGGTTVKSKHSCSKLLEPAGNGDDGNTLQFESRFESGNLLKAIKIGPFHYELWLRTDLYTEKYTQWYYFRVENMIANIEYHFTIMNLMKSTSLYSEGMKPLFYSDKEAKEQKIGWHRVGENIKYYKNGIKSEDSKGLLRSLYSLTWTVRFPYDEDQCYFAHCYPYTYTDLQEYLRKLSKDSRRSSFLQQKILTRSLAGNVVYLITVTNPSKCPSDAKRKRAVIFTARVHPGETNSSWMMKGLLDYLTSDKHDAKLLRDTFVFKIVPMLNPDGVVVGNYRCSLSGRDLNRNYKTDFKEAFPSVWHTREMIKCVIEQREVILYCDLHGHSRQNNVFIYGCEDRNNVTNGFKERVFPMMMSKNCRDKFCFKRCKFKVQKSKSGTGRIVMWNLGIRNSYTLEATFCGSTLGPKAGHHFFISDYEAMGYHLCDTLLDYCDPDLSKYLVILRELDVYVKDFILARMKESGEASTDMQCSDIDLDHDYISQSSTDGSDSSVSDGPPMQMLYTQRSERNITKKKKRRLKTRKERNKEHTKTLMKATEGHSTTDKSGVDKSHDDMQSGPNKECLPSTVTRRVSRTNPSHERHKRATPPHHLHDVKVRHYFETISTIKQPNPSKISAPELRITSGLCLGLAPAAFSNYHKPSLSRWSLRHRRNSVVGSTQQREGDDEEEGSFIERYLARQMAVVGYSSQSKDKEWSNDQPNTQDDKEHASRDKHCLYHAALRHHTTRRPQYEEREPLQAHDTYEGVFNRDRVWINEDHSGFNGLVPDCEGIDSDCEGSDGDHERLSSLGDEEDVKRSQSMKTLHDKENEDKKGGLVTRSKSDSNLPPLHRECDQENYVDFRQVPHYPINDYQRQDSVLDQPTSINESSHEPLLVTKPVQFENTFPDLRSNSKTTMTTAIRKMERK